MFKILIDLKNWKHKKELDTIKKCKVDWKKDKIKHLEINILVTKIKNSMAEINSKLDTATEKINYLKDRSEDIIQRYIICK